MGQFQLFHNSIDIREESTLGALPKLRSPMRAAKRVTTIKAVFITVDGVGSTINGTAESNTFFRKGNVERAGNLTKIISWQVAVWMHVNSCAYDT